MADVIDAIIAEALGEGPAGMAAVAHVINTRALQTGKTPQQIINEVGQFSGVSSPGSSVAQSMKDPAVRAQVREIWNGVTSGQIPNPYPGADYFHTPQVSPQWASSYTKAGQLGNHIFYSSGRTPAPSKEAPAPMAPIMRPSNSAVAAIDSAAPATDWLTYANQGATRNQPVSSDLEQALSFLPELGVTMEVFSGGQPGAGEGPRVGSTRHDHGGAADVFFYKGGRKLDWANPADVPVFEQIVQRGKANGLTGFGAGDGYMQPGSMHIGFGAPAVWGAGGKGSNAPIWLKNAYNSGGTAMAYAAPNAGAPKPPVMVGMPRPRPHRGGGGIFGNIVDGVTHVANLAGQHAAPIMRSAQAVGQNAAPVIMRSALGSVAGRTALIDPMIQRVFSSGAPLPPNAVANAQRAVSQSGDTSAGNQLEMAERRASAQAWRDSRR